MANRRHILQSLGAFPMLAAFGVSHAEAWPSRPLRIVVPNAPGGTSDIIGRLLTKPLSDALGQPVIIENRAGAGGNIGAAAVAQATDQHTVLLCDVGGLAISPSIYKTLPYNLDRDLQGVAMLAQSPHLLAVHPSVEANNLQELIALSKRTRLNVALAGQGTPNHLATVQLAQITGIQWQHVPYKGGAPAVGDTVANVTQAVLNGMAATYPQVQGGKLKAIGVAGKTRSPLLPNLPTLAEQGATDFESGTWQGVTVSSKLPKDQVARLHAELVRIVQEPALRAQLRDAGVDMVAMSPVETTQFIARDRVRWAKVVKQAGNTIEGST
ncbi:ABC transporter substrate-binding protein [Rhodoferax koreense]|uniref:ABC transporter substrate-binding protein n=1 Tax=Rhodoferax koreensis TaxID=1842727 RepID=A0A1P8K1R5_9BURK|nr:tripartite tricarboxylate transporter substrate-binding protein [Rhodoferax koreense]APW39935.1 ABC transporter substrate-binding protein [Rhodoferax koreense]